MEYRPDKRAWAIACEPHVALVLKRVFAKLDRYSHGVHLLSDTLETSRDLDWFLQRYPMEVKGAEHLEEQKRLHVEASTLVDNLLSRRISPQPFSLAIPAREYQTLAANLLLTRKSVLLADDVGLGKTASAICSFTDKRTLPALVVTLAHLPTQWRYEIKKFAPRLRTHVVKKGTPYDLTVRRQGQQMLIPETFPDVVIINYHKLAGWAETIAPLVNSVVFDECQELRHSDSAKWKAAAHIASKADFRLGLSATPIYNYGDEMFNVMEVIAPGALGLHEEFIREWCTFVGNNKYSIKKPEIFGSYLKETGLMLRRTRIEVGRELPPIMKVPQYVHADEAALDKVSDSCAELARIILAQGEAYRGQKMESAGRLDNLIRQATGIAKAPYVAEFVRLLTESGESVILYGWHRAVYDIWMDRLKELNPVMYTGSESPAQKETAKEKFLKGQAKVMIISLRAGAGMDGLQEKCCLSVHGELDWSPGVHEQNTGRIARDGQQRSVTCYFMISNYGSDPLMAEVLGIKKAQVEGIRDDKKELVEKLQAADTGHIRRLAEMYLKKQYEKESDKTKTKFPTSLLSQEAGLEL